MSSSWSARLFSLPVGVLQPVALALPGERAGTMLVILQIACRAPASGMPERSARLSARGRQPHRATAGMPRRDFPAMALSASARRWAERSRRREQCIDT